MYATIYTVQSNGVRNEINSVYVGTNNKQINGWISQAIKVWEQDGWFIKGEEDGVLIFHRGVNEGAMEVVVA